MANQHNYLNTVVSTWWYPVVDEEANLFARPNLKLIVNHVPDTTQIYNDQNRYLQFKSTYSGLLEVQTEYVIKARSDEYYLNLNPAAMKFLSNPNKVLTNNVFFRKTKYLPYHPSDHLIIAKTELLKTVYKKCIQQCENDKEKLEEGYFNQIPKRIVPEQQFAINVIKTLEKKSFKLPTKIEDIDKMRAITKKHFDVINTQYLGQYRVTSRKYGKFDNNMNFLLPEIDILNSLEEL
jgi:hypothetical protein